MVFVKGESGRNLDGTFKEGYFTEYEGRKVMGKFKGSRRTKNSKPNERGEWQYQDGRPDCVNCSLPARYHSKTPDGSVKYWRNLCTMCHKNQGQEQYRYRLNKKSYCELCGFKAKHRVQLDVDHKDGNHSNNSEDNLQTICANCHRLKTVLSGDHNGVKYIPAITGLKLENE
jgi:cytochrome c553